MGDDIECGFILAAGYIFSKAYPKEYLVLAYGIATAFKFRFLTQSPYSTVKPIKYFFVTWINIFLIFLVNLCFLYSFRWYGITEVLEWQLQASKLFSSS